MNYGELKETLRNYLYNRRDLQNNIPTLIELAERRIFRTLRAPVNESVFEESNLRDEKIQLPNDYLEAKLVMVDGRPLERRSDIDVMHMRHQNSPTSIPRYFARSGAYLYIWFPNYGQEDGDPGQFTMVYYKDFSGALRNDSDTNEILRIAPELYIYGGMVEAMGFLAHDERVPVWEQYFNMAMAEIAQQASEAELSGSIVAIAGVYGDA